MTEITRRGLMTPSCWLVIPSRGILAKKTNFIFRAAFTWKILHLPSSYAPHKKTIFACNVKKYSRMPRSVDELAAQSGQRLKPGRCSRTIRFGYQEGCGANVVLTRRVMARFAFNRGTGEVAAPPVPVHTSIWDLFSCYRISQQNRGANVVQMPHSLAGPADIYRTIV